jgi:hypothetical protein
MPDEALEKLLGDARLIRHWGKLKSVRDNAAAMIEIGEEFGSFGSWLATWPGSNRRVVGRARCLLQPDGRRIRANVPAHGRQGHVCAVTFGDRRAQALGRAAAAKKPQGPRRGASLLQRLGAESGLPLSQMSLILALSVDD